MELTEEQDIQRAQGIRVQRRNVVSVVFTRQQVYDLLALLKHRAMHTENYDDLEQAADFVRWIRTQARKQGY